MLLGMASTAVGIQLLWWLCLPAVIHSLEIFPFVFLVAYNLHPCHLFPPRFRLSVLEAVTRYFQINLSLYPLHSPHLHHDVVTGSCSYFASYVAETKETPRPIELVSGQACLI